MGKNKILKDNRYLDFELLRNAGQKDYKIEYSLLSGYDFYKVSHGEENAYLGVHVRSENIVRIKIIGRRKNPLKHSEILYYRRYIWNTMPQERYEWPIDLIEYRDESQMYVQCYVFPLRPYPKYTPIRELLFQEKTSRRLDWRNEEIKKICRNLLNAFDGLHQNGYFYNDFCIDRIFFEPETKEIFLRFTSGIRFYKQGKEQSKFISYGEDVNKNSHMQIGEQEPVTVKDISIEFAPPYIYSKQEYCENIDYYSISSMIFLLMIGRLPYEGKGLNNFGEVFDPIRDVDPEAHEYYFEHYHQFPKFIFDIEDNSNSLGPMSENDLPKERWAKLPDKIKQMFQETLSYYVQGKGRLYSPKEWLTELNCLCWNEHEEGRIKEC